MTAGVGRLLVGVQMDGHKEKKKNGRNACFPCAWQEGGRESSG